MDFFSPPGFLDENKIVQFAKMGLVPSPELRRVIERDLGWSHSDPPQSLSCRRLSRRLNKTNVKEKETTCWKTALRDSLPSWTWLKRKGTAQAPAEHKAEPQLIEEDITLRLSEDDAPPSCDGSDSGNHYEAPRTTRNSTRRTRGDWENASRSYKESTFHKHSVEPNIYPIGQQDCRRHHYKDRKFDSLRRHEFRGWSRHNNYHSHKDAAKLRHDWRRHRYTADKYRSRYDSPRECADRAHFRESEGNSPTKNTDFVPSSAHELARRNRRCDKRIYSNTREYASNRRDSSTNASSVSSRSSSWKSVVYERRGTSASPRWTAVGSESMLKGIDVADIPLPPPTTESVSYAVEPTLPGCNELGFHYKTENPSQIKPDCMFMRKKPSNSLSPDTSIVKVEPLDISSLSLSVDSGFNTEKSANSDSKVFPVKRTPVKSGTIKNSETLHEVESILSPRKRKSSINGSDIEKSPSKSKVLSGCDQPPQKMSKLSPRSRRSIFRDSGAPECSSDLSQLVHSPTPEKINKSEFKTTPSKSLNAENSKPRTLIVTRSTEKAKKAVDEYLGSPKLLRSGKKIVNNGVRSPTPQKLLKGQDCRGRGAGSAQKPGAVRRIYSEGNEAGAEHAKPVVSSPISRPGETVEDPKQSAFVFLELLPQQQIQQMLLHSVDNNRENCDKNTRRLQEVNPIPSPGVKKKPLDDVEIHSELPSEKMLNSGEMSEYSFIGDHVKKQLFGESILADELLVTALSGDRGLRKRDSRQTQPSQQVHKVSKSEESYRGRKVSVFCPVLKEDVLRHPVQRKVPQEKWWKWLNPRQLKYLVTNMLENPVVCLNFSNESDGHDEWETMWHKWASYLNSMCYSELTKLNTGLTLTVAEWKMLWLTYKQNLLEIIANMSASERVHNLGMLEIMLISEDLYNAVKQSRGACLGAECPRKWCVGSCQSVGPYRG